MADPIGVPSLLFELMELAIFVPTNADPDIAKPPPDAPPPGAAVRAQAH
jgi:hypothetical protein